MKAFPAACRACPFVKSKLALVTCSKFPADGVLQLNVPVQVLTDAEVEWINNYHKDVWEKASPRIQDKDVLKWLEMNTQPLQVPKMDHA